MISVKVNYRSHVVTIKGHSGYGERGKDIVCSAVSILFYTLAESLLKDEHMFPKNGLRIRDVSGDSRIACMPLRKYQPTVNVIFGVFCNGIKLLADRYPDNVELTVVGG